MKKLYLILLIVMTLGISCERINSTSSKPTFFVVKTMRQDNWDKRTNVTQYLLEVWIYNKTPTHQKNTWYTLQEGFQVGDTLKFTK